MATSHFNSLRANYLPDPLSLNACGPIEDNAMGGNANHGARLQAVRRSPRSSAHGQGRPLLDVRRGRWRGRGVPPFKYVIPAFAARSSRVRYNWQETQIAQSRLNLRDVLL